MEIRFFASNSNQRPTCFIQKSEVFNNGVYWTIYMAKQLDIE